MRKGSVKSGDYVLAKVFNEEVEMFQAGKVTDANFVELTPGNGYIYIDRIIKIVTPDIDPEYFL